MRRALYRAWRRMSQHTLRITTHQDEHDVRITLEGRIAGPWADELSRTWNEIRPVLGQRKLSLDLRNTTYADGPSILVLHSIYTQTVAELITSSPWTKYLADEITRSRATLHDEEN